MSNTPASSKLPNSELLIYDGRIYHTNIPLMIRSKKSTSKSYLPPRIFLVGDPARAYEVAKHFDTQSEPILHREFIIIKGTCHGIEMAVAGTGIGTDNTEIIITELYAVYCYLLDYLQNHIWVNHDVQPIVIRLGTSGSPQADAPIGSLGIGSYSAGFDSTGLFILDRPIEQFLAGNFEEIFYTPPGGDICRAIWLAYKQLFVDCFPIPVIVPYVSAASPRVVQALNSACNLIETDNPALQHFLGIVTASSGFFAGQGRKIGPKLSNILFPDMQEKLMTINVSGLRPIINEMESSCLYRYCQVLGWQCGTICLILANRAEGDLLTPEKYRQGVDACIEAGLNAMVALSQKG
ncbi:MAG: nucleoside phosphorylase-like protein [uncultured bacterium]|nr:MAG: nucleoside phosphorylase-like protein [uncultured bacterium]